MLLIHFTPEPFIFDPHVKYKQEGNFKPVGLWVSVEDEGSYGWKEWCEGSEFQTSALVHRAQIVLKPGANILLLDTLEKIDAFQAEYYCGDFASKLWGIDWARVTRNYHGILISPYRHERRFELSFIWYYSWDCESGCIWDLSVIEEVRVEMTT